MPLECQNQLKKLLDTKIEFIKTNQKKIPNNFSLLSPGFGSIMSSYQEPPQINRSTFVAPFVLKNKNNHSDENISILKNKFRIEYTYLTF